MTVRWFDIPVNDWVTLNAKLRRMAAETTAAIAAGGGGGGGGVTDGDKGDIVVSGSGATWLFDPTVVTAAGKALLDDATVADQRNTLGLRTGTASLAITPAQFRHATVTIADANATTGRTCHPHLIPNADFDADDLGEILVVAECGSGTITFTLTTAGPLVGTYAVTYLLTGP